MPRPANFSDAAVLVVICQGKILLTVRSAHLPHHAAQIAFPGGRLDPGEDFGQAALREAWEEVGLEPSLVEPLGWLNHTYSPFGFRVAPLVAWVQQEPVLCMDPNEVAEVLWVPLGELLEVEPYSETREANGIRRQVWFYPWQGYTIWGLTGGILHELVGRLRHTH